MTSTLHRGLYHSLLLLAREHGARLAIQNDRINVTYSDLLAESDCWQKALHPARGMRVGVAVSPSPKWVALMGALDKLSTSAFLVSPQAAQVQKHRIVSEFGLAGIMDDSAQVERPSSFGLSGAGPQTEGPLVVLLTSGTTGKAKAVQHTWESLRRPVRLDSRFLGMRFMLTYPLHLYAGLQVFLQAFLNGGTLVLLPGNLGAAETCQYMLEQAIEHTSATPSFWRRLLVFGSTDKLRRVPLKQITLGGEVVTDDLLEMLRQMFPAARIVHIYATSELGRCFAVADGRAGFPLHFLHESPEVGVSLRVVGGELHVRSANAMRGYDPGSGLRADLDDWLPTGDLVEVVGERVRFRGRVTDVINVAGSKVYPVEVETVLRGVEGVADARVYPLRSSLAGELVAAEVVAKPGYPAEELRRQLVAYCLSRLLPQQRPRHLEIVPSLQVTEADKIPRREISR